MKPLIMYNRCSPTQTHFMLPPDYFGKLKKKDLAVYRVDFETQKASKVKFKLDKGIQITIDKCIQKAESINPDFLLIFLKDETKAIEVGK